MSVDCGEETEINAGGKFYAIRTQLYGKTTQYYIDCLTQKKVICSTGTVAVANAIAQELNRRAARVEIEKKTP